MAAEGKLPKVLVTGACGQVGADLIPLLTPDLQVLAGDLALVDSLGYDCPCVQLDITDPGTVCQTVTDWRPDVIVNLVALTNVDQCEREPQLARRVNVDGVENLLMVLPAGGHFIQISTDYIFDGAAGPYRETDPPNPINQYGLTKLAAEELLIGGTMDWTVIRTNVVFGASIHTGASFLKWVVDSLRCGQSIKVVDDQWNNPTWTVGLAEMIRQAIETRLTGVYNYAGSDYLNRLDFARLIARSFGLAEDLITPISTASLRQIAARPLRGGLVTDRTVAATGIRAYSLPTALATIRAQGIL
ncbi:MAG: SDR family oxidoreductase [Candidatus Neomarinimicrobiota bacterium]